MSRPRNQNPPRPIAKWSTYSAIVEVYNPTWWERLVTLGQIALEQLVVLAFTVAVIACSSLVRSWLWLWFLVPAFHVPVINTLQMAGLVFLIQAMTFRTAMADEALKRASHNTKDNWPGFLTHCANSALSWSLIWAVGYAASRIAGVK